MRNRVKQLFVIVLLIMCMNIFAKSSEQIVATTVSYNIEINNELIYLKSPLVTIDNKTYVPLREFAEYIGFNVVWKGTEKKINMY